MLNSSQLILPGDPLFDLTLLTPRPDWREKAGIDGNQYAFAVDPDNGLARPVTSQELEEYLYGGEYDERLSQIDERTRRGCLGMGTREEE